MLAIAAAVTGAMRVPTTATPVPNWMRDVRVAATAKARVHVGPDHLAVGEPRVAVPELLGTNDVVEIVDLRRDAQSNIHDPPRVRCLRPYPPILLRADAQGDGPSVLASCDVTTTRTTFTLDEELAEQARRLDINISLAARQGVAAAVRTALADADRAAYQQMPEKPDTFWSEAEAWSDE